MSIRSKILAGCMALTVLTGVLGGYAQRAERELGALAFRIYDDAFMGVSYLRSAQVGFASLAEAGRNGSLQPAAVSAVLEDLDVARDRAMSPAGRNAAESLSRTIRSVVGRGGQTLAGPDVLAVQAQFEQAVETFADDGFRYRRSVGALVAAQVRRTSVVVGVTVLIALSITVLLTQMIAPPVRRAVRIAQLIAAGQLDNAISVTGRGETAELLRALSIMQGSIVQALARIQGLMNQQATHHAGELAAQHARLEAALGNMNQGLCLFGADGRLAVANRRFVEMFGEPEPEALAETVLRNAGLHMLLESGRDGAVAALSCELPDGRSIAVSQQAVASGGWVATYEDISERRATEGRLAHMARHDPLTGLPNRLLFSERMQQTLARARRGDGIAVLCLDLDRFKTVNDTLGHAAGDALLRAVTERLRQCTRETDLVVRFGGDEFVIVQEKASQPTDATALARRLVEMLGQAFDIDQQEVVIGVSIGIALSMDGLETPDALLKRADLALYRAKDDGRGTFRFFEREMDAAMQARRTLEIDLRKALAEEQFELYYQPLVQTGGIAGFEALLRWHHPTRGLVSPAEFIPVAEEIGLIGVIGAWVMSRACIDAAGWPGALKVAVNLSPAQFRTRSLAEDAAHALSTSGLAATRLELEITESVLIQDEAAVLDSLHALRAMGIRIAMDDFGTGYSSLSYLRRFPFDKIKIDQSFVKGIEDQEDSRTIVRAVIGLGRSLGIAVNAEGVETAEQLAALRAEGCGEIQGYLFSKPKPVQEIADLLLRFGNSTTPAAARPEQVPRDPAHADKVASLVAEA
ncbi:putative bifunctional diguanylate cyclase/phosphodiesterase [Rhodopila sp.]|uniref:putative bifunctional diguanylate cyclase/phosphodiesterase n=1 Tax=Rhodopila sp. TaxID=2480087 RepID=UPI003D11A611